MDESLQIPPFITSSVVVEASKIKLSPLTNNCDSSRLWLNQLSHDEALKKMMPDSTQETAWTTNENQPCKKSFRNSQFDVKSDVFSDISSCIQSVRYQYAPKHVTFVLKDLYTSEEPNPLFEWLSNGISGDALTVIALDNNGDPLYEHEFLGCYMFEHACNMSRQDYDKCVYHIVTVKYEHVNRNCCGNKNHTIDES